jgi:hypothetical protein
VDAADDQDAAAGGGWTEREGEQRSTVHRPADQGTARDGCDPWRAEECGPGCGSCGVREGQEAVSADGSGAAGRGDQEAQREADVFHLRAPHLSLILQAIALRAL